MYILAYAAASSEDALKAANFPYLLIDTPTDIAEQVVRHLPAIVIVEAQPDNDWLAILTMLAQDPVMSPIPLLALTPPELRSQALEAGATELLCAPLDPVELQTRIRNLDYVSLTGSLDVLAHDLNNPIGITSFSLDLALEIMGSEPNFPDLPQLIHNVLLSNHRLRFMVDDVLDFLRLTANTYALNLMEVDVPEVVKAATKMIQAIASQNKIVIQTHIPDDLPQPIGDDRLLERVVNAALDTAIKFCQPSSTIQVKASADHQGVTLSIIDPGHPVTAGYYPGQLFHVGYISSARDAGSRSAVALSLPFCYAAMTRMKGKISLNSGNGLTTLSLWLPLNESA